jgi:hypothetical protein
MADPMGVRRRAAHRLPKLQPPRHLWVIVARATCRLSSVVEARTAFQAGPPGVAAHKTCPAESTVDFAANARQRVAAHIAFQADRQEVVDHKATLMESGCRHYVAGSAASRGWQKRSLPKR